MIRSERCLIPVMDRTVTMSGILSFCFLLVLFMETECFPGEWGAPITQRPHSNNPPLNIGNTPKTIRPATSIPLGVWGTPVIGSHSTKKFDNGQWGPPIRDKPTEDTPTSPTHNLIPQATIPTNESPGENDDESVVNEDSRSCPTKASRCGLCTCCWMSNVIRASCSGSNITDIPMDLPKNITHMKLHNTGIIVLTAQYHRELNYTKFERYPKLKELHFLNNKQLSTMERGALRFRLTSENSLESLFIDGSEKLKEIAPGVLGIFSKLSNLKIVHCGLESPPKWFLFNSLRDTLDLLDLSYNHIKELKIDDFAQCGQCIKTGKLTLTHNSKLEAIHDYAFRDANIGHLILSHNKNLATLGSHAFAGIKSFYTLDLSYTAIHHLPSIGLSSVEDLLIVGTPTLQTFISVLQLHSIERAKLTYQHHCCAFAHPEKQDEDIYEQFMADMERDCSTTASETVATTSMMTSLANPMKDSRQRRHTYHTDLPQTVPRNIRRYMIKDFLPRPLFNDRNRRANVDGGQWLSSTINPNKNHTSKVICGDFIQHIKDTSCTPKADAFNPCEDVLGYVWLRIVCWFIFTTAIFGNLFVIIVTLGNKARMSVSKLLIFNLSLSDLVLGVYLAILAAFDLHSKGAYFTLAIPWQNNGGCQAAGFLATFSTCLSVFTLTVITVERWYAIRNALDPNKRIRLRVASVVMTGGWVYSLLMAVLPLVGISSYSKTSICLPMETEDPVDLAYVIMLMLINAGCFIVICVCYGDIYRRVHTNSAPAGHSDVNIAKRMALLVVTDFVCLFPIVFFGLTAAFGHPLISVSNSKVLLVICFPLNSCANPFLYAIKTKHFRRDLFEMLSRCGYCEQRATKYRMALTNPMTYSQSRGSLSGTTQNLIHRPSLGSTTFTTCLAEPSVKGSKGSLANNALNFAENTRMTNHAAVESDPSSPNLSPSGMINGYHPLSTNDATQTSPQQGERTLDGRKLSVVMEGSMASGLSGEESQCDSNDRPTDQSDQSNFESRDDLTKQACTRVRSVSEYSDKPLYKVVKQNNTFETDNNHRKGSEATCLTELSDYSFNTLKSNSSLDTDISNKSPGNSLDQRKTFAKPAPKHSLPGDSGFGEINGHQNGDYDTLGNLSVGSSDVFHASDNSNVCENLSTHCSDKPFSNKALKNKTIESIPINVVSNRVHPHQDKENTQNNLNRQYNPHGSTKASKRVTSCLPLNIDKDPELRDSRPLSDGYFNTGYTYGNSAQETVG